MKEERLTQLKANLKPFRNTAVNLMKSKVKSFFFRSFPFSLSIGEMKNVFFNWLRWKCIALNTCLTFSIWRWKHEHKQYRKLSSATTFNFLSMHQQRHGEWRKPNGNHCCYVFITNAIVYILFLFFCFYLFLRLSKNSTCNLFVIRLCIVGRESDCQCGSMSLCSRFSIRNICQWFSFDRLLSCRHAFHADANVWSHFARIAAPLT